MVPYFGRHGTKKDVHGIIFMPTKIVYKLWVMAKL